MTVETEKSPELEREIYEQGALVERLRREVYQQVDPSANEALLNELADAEQALAELEQKKAASHDPSSGLIVNTTGEPDARGLRGLKTTGLEAKVYLRMETIPTSYYHLLIRDENPLVTCEVKAATFEDFEEKKRRVRLTSFIEGYSARAIDTFEVGEEPHCFHQLPTLFPKRIRQVRELTRATLNILVEDLDGKVEIHETYPVWLLARTSAPLLIKDPQTGVKQDLTRYLGAFVTPNAPSLMEFLRKAARLHPDGRLVGYQGMQDGVPLQVKAIFEALKNDAEVTYVNSLVNFNPQQGFYSQRLRLPRESLKDKEANCIDGTVLMASLLEGISLHPAIVLVPGHAFLAWETWKNSGAWCYLETTMIGSNTFEEACASAEKTAGIYQKKDQLRVWQLNDLRVKHSIYPLE